MCDEIAEGQMARWRKLGAQVGCDEKDYKLEDFVPIVSGSPVTSTAKAGAEDKDEDEARVGDRDGRVADDAAPDTGDTVEEAAVSQAEGQTGEDLEPIAI